MLVESDAQRVILAITNPDFNYRFHFTVIVDDCKSPAQEMMNVSCVFASKSANEAVHLCARTAHSTSCFWSNLIKLK